jgi:two-component system, OmpR family, response regulator CpxR
VRETNSDAFQCRVRPDSNAVQRLRFGSSARRTAPASDRPAAPIMIVEDDADLRAVIGDLLRLSGHAVCDVANGRQALEVLSAGVEPSMLLIDWLMPEMGGAELLQRLAMHPRWSRLPAVVLTGMPHIRVPTGIRLIQKPVSIEHLMSVVQDCCGAEPAYRERASGVQRMIEDGAV